MQRGLEKAQLGYGYSVPTADDHSLGTHFWKSIIISPWGLYHSVLVILSPEIIFYYLAYNSKGYKIIQSCIYIKN